MRATSIPDPRGPLRSTRKQIVEGIFGRHTAIVDFCEDNYQITSYIAEFWNTLSNSAYIILGILGLHYANKERLPGNAKACSIALIVLGIGSGLFHATLMKTAMMLDDLPMMWLVSVLLYCAVQIDPNATNYPLIAGLVTLNLIVLVCDLSEVNQVYHYTMFAMLAFASAGRFMYLGYMYPNAVTPSVRRSAAKYFLLGLLAIFTGFGIWNVDNIYCDDIQPYKERYGMPIALILEGHVWWHILTAIGEYLCVMSGTCIVLAIQEGHQNFEFANGVMGVPYVKRSVPISSSLKKAQ